MSGDEPGPFSLADPHLDPGASRRHRIPRRLYHLRVAYVLAGSLHLILADHDLVLKPGEAAEFDTRLPHCFLSADKNPVEILSLFGGQGERLWLKEESCRGGPGGWTALGR